MTVYTKSVGREKWAQAIKIGDLTEYSLFGWGVTDASQEYESDEETTKYVTQKAGMTINKGYTLTQGVEQTVYVDDPLFKVIDNIRKRQLLGEDASGKLLNVNLYDKPDEDKPALVSGEEFDISITINSFGGSSDDRLPISYTINLNGAPKIGNVALTWGADDITFEFTEEVVPPVGG